MIRAVLFDLDGVIRHFDHDPGLERRHRLADGAIARIAFASPLIDEVTTGRISRSEWIARVAEHTGEAAAAEWGRTPFHADEEVLRLAAELRAIGIPCAILTNGTDTISDELRTHGIDRHFDRVFNSAEIGHAKPDTRAFQHVVDTLGIPAENIFFTDDSPAKLAGADALSMTTHVFTDVTGLRLALREAGVGTPASRSTPKMHARELDIDAATVRGLLDEQHPQWRHEEIRRVASEGTVNAIFRIGDALAARLPLEDADPEDLRATLDREAAAMRELGAVCPVPTPAPVAVGEPGPGYPLPWSVQTWVPGDVATPNGLAHSATFARDLADLILALRGADTRGRTFGRSGRGGDLRDSDEWMETCFRESAGLLPVDDLRALWAHLRMLPAAGPDVMTHGDLTPGNLLVSGERLAGVLDGGGFAPADPSLDLVSAWHLLDAEAREILRRILGSGDVEWRRGAAWAFQQAMGLVWYYRESNPGMSALGRSTLHRILTAAKMTVTASPRGL